MGAARTAEDAAADRRRGGPRLAGDEEANEGEVDALSGVGEAEPPVAASTTLASRQRHGTGQVTGRCDKDRQWRVVALTCVVRRLPIHCNQSMTVIHLLTSNFTRKTVETRGWALDRLHNSRWPLDRLQ